MMATALGFLALAVVADVGTQPPGAIELPPYFDRAITHADLEGRSLRDLELMRDVLLYRMGEPVLKGWLSYDLPAAPGFLRTATRRASRAMSITSNRKGSRMRSRCPPRGKGGCSVC